MAYHNSNIPYGGPARAGADFVYVDQYGMGDYDNSAAPQLTATSADLQSFELFSELFDFDFEPQPDPNLPLTPEQYPSLEVRLPVMIPGTNDNVATTALVAPNSSKRPYKDTDEPMDFHDERKRSKKTPNGFPCQHPRCDKLFDRAGDRRKHEQRTHMPESSRPCVCPHPNCGKRFHWHKDVVRHQKQMHRAIAPEGHRPVLQLTTQAHDGHDSDSKSTSSTDSSNHGKPEHRRQIQEPETPASKGISVALAFSRSIVLLKGRIRLRRKTLSEASGRFIFVTTNESTFQLVDARGLSDAESIIKSIRKSMEVPDKYEITIHRYHLGRGNRELLDGEQLASVVSKHADGLGSLKLHLTIVKKESEVDDTGA